MLIGGIDPGLKGGLALVESESLELVDVISLPTICEIRGNSEYTGIDAAPVYLKLMVNRPAFVWVENIGAMRRDAKRSLGSMMRGLGRIEGILQALKLETRYVTAQQWHKLMLVSGDSRVAIKAASCRRAAQLWPGQKEVFLGPRGGALDGRAEAALIAAYGTSKL